MKIFLTSLIFLSIYVSLLTLTVALKLPKADHPLIVHLIPHTHDDVGWRKTVDQYYYGRNSSHQFAHVENILNNSIEALLKNENRTFTYVEMKFFSMWWERQNETIKEQVRNLVREGRLEFVNGGWSANDEACPQYTDIITNMIKGHQYLLREFGVKPRIGWSIDAFGHSNANARLFADMGFEALFFARLDFQDRKNRIH